MKTCYVVLNCDQMNCDSDLDNDIGVLYYLVDNNIHSVMLIQFPKEIFSYSNHSVLKI